MSASYHVLIIGAGRIGAFFDTPDSANILTHAHAFSVAQGFKLLGFVDHDFEAAKRAAYLWSTQAFQTLEEVFDKHQIDIVCIATPDEYHYALLKQLAQFSFKLVFAEKPLTKTLAEAQDVIATYHKKNIPILVNYTRRFVPEFEQIRTEIQRGYYGRYLTGTGYYGKGILHNGSHMIDFLSYMFGTVQALSPISKLNDFYSDDPAVSVVLTFRNGGKFFLQAVDCNAYTIFEIDLLFEKKRLRIIDSGFNVEMYEVRQNSVFHGYNNMVKVGIRKTSLGNALYYVAENICATLTGKDQLRCTALDAYEAMKTCLEIQSSFYEQEKNITVCS